MNVVTTATIESAEPKTVCVIGAGAAGLCAAHNCALQPNITVTIFEQGSRRGGTWVYESDPATARIQSSMYESLVTNLPKEVMAFREFPFDDRFAVESFVRREVVLEYLEAYSRSIANHIQYNSRVVSVEPTEEILYMVKKQDQAPSVEPLADSKHIKWRVTVDKDGRNTVYVFDCVFVCNGHLSVPKFPDFATIYKKPAIHSHNYRRPQDFARMKVAVVGAGPSGCDIASQLVGHAAEVMLLYKDAVPATPLFGRMRNASVQTAALVGAEPDALLLAGGERVDDFDYIIFCTGYNYSFPFFRHTVTASDDVEFLRKRRSLTVDCSVAEAAPLLWLDAGGRIIRPLFAHVAHVDYVNSLFFIGIPFVTVPFVLFEQQVHFAIGLMSGWLLAERIVLESDIHEFEARQFRTLEKAGLSPILFHRMGDQQWEYYDWLWRCYAVKSTARVSRLRVPPVVRAIYEHCEAERRRDVEQYHRIQYEIVSDSEFRAIYPEDYLMNEN